MGGFGWLWVAIGWLWVVTWHYECFLVVMVCYLVVRGGNGWSGVDTGIQEVVVGVCGVVTGGYEW